MTDLTAFFDDLVRCETRLYNALNDTLRERHGIVTSQFEFLRYLRAHPAARVADLALEFAVGIGATSKGIDRLELKGWVSRTPHPTDRRSSVLTLTPSGRTLIDEATETFTRRLTELTAPAHPDLPAAARALAALRTALDASQTGQPAG